MDENSKSLESQVLNEFTSKMQERLISMQKKDHSFTSISLASDDENVDIETFLLDTMNSLRQDAQNYVFYREQGSDRKQLLVDIALKAMMSWSLK